MARGLVEFGVWQGEIHNMQCQIQALNMEQRQRYVERIGSDFLALVIERIEEKKVQGKGKARKNMWQDTKKWNDLI